MEDLTDDDVLTHYELCVALKELPDYEEYGRLPKWSLFDAVCESPLIC
jgi:hypothetical protein